MKVVWKYRLQFADEQVIEMPVGATVAHVGMQDGYLCLWMIVDPSQAKRGRHLYVRGTGHPLEDTLTYLGSAVEEDRPLVWHVFERE
jgi:hypothetical protein